MPIEDTADRFSAVTIVLEDTQDRYLIHRELISRHSAFVRQCLSSGSKEGQTQGIIIRDWKEKESMDLMMNWLYSGFEAVTDQLWDGDLSYEHKMVDLYILADRLMIGNLKNDIVDAYRSHVRSLDPDFDLLKLLDVHCPEMRGLKLLLLDDLAQKIYDLPVRRHWFGDFALLMAKDDPIAIAATKLMIARMNESTDLKFLPKCGYHEHETGTERCDGSIAD